ncbi:LAME_0F08812g1_1 [Lachancea meyersii CBS 8951]|uniref:LAME_0F08812g1_1 n=1 Tax=Lachancea meyersii CBS 8951 TaxID=1266667 RepID=A0A1G4JUQ5_9SACH|nr:LAME_0F08812g1_1 [Lachancea meyersii CBS 8951]
MARKAHKDEGKLAQKWGKGPQINENGVLLVQPPKSVPNKDHMQRLNYLFQASTYHTIVDQDDKSHALSRMYMRNLDLIQKKTKSALTPGMKRQICKRCHRVLVPMRTLEQSVVNESKNNVRQSQVLVLTCKCGSKKRFPYGQDTKYKTHVERDNLIFLQR